MIKTVYNNVHGIGECTYNNANFMSTVHGET